MLWIIAKLEKILIVSSYLNYRSLIHFLKGIDQTYMDFSTQQRIAFAHPIIQPDYPEACFHAYSKTKTLFDLLDLFVRFLYTEEVAQVVK